MSTPDVQQSEQRLWALTHLAQDWVRDQPARLRVTIGTPFIEVIQAVLRDGHDLVIKPVRERPSSRGLFASTDMHLLRKCPCPVWIDREPESPGSTQPADPTDVGAEPRCARVLAAVDATQPDSLTLNRSILDAAAAVAGLDDAALDVVHAWQAPYDGSLAGAGPAEHNPRLADAIGLLECEHGAALSGLVADYRPRLNGSAAIAREQLGHLSAMFR